MSLTKSINYVYKLKRYILQQVKTERGDSIGTVDYRQLHGCVMQQLRKLQLGAVKNQALLGFDTFETFEIPVQVAFH